MTRVIRNLLVLFTLSAVIAHFWRPDSGGPGGRWMTNIIVEVPSVMERFVGPLGFRIGATLAIAWALVRIRARWRKSELWRIQRPSVSTVGPRRAPLTVTVMNPEEAALTRRKEIRRLAAHHLLDRDNSGMSEREARRLVAECAAAFLDENSDLDVHSAAKRLADEADHLRRQKAEDRERVQRRQRILDQAVRFLVEGTPKLTPAVAQARVAAVAKDILIGGTKEDEAKVAERLAIAAYLERIDEGRIHSDAETGSYRMRGAQ